MVFNIGMLNACHAPALSQNRTTCPSKKARGYFSSVRELEHRLATAEGWIGKPKPKVTAAKTEELSDRNDLPKSNRVMFELVRLALRPTARASSPLLRAREASRIEAGSFSSGTATMRELQMV